MPPNQDFSYLAYYAYSEVPPNVKPADTVLASLKNVPIGTPLEEIKRACDAFGLDPIFMKAVAKIESGLDPSDWVVTEGAQRAFAGAKVEPQRSKLTSVALDASDAAKTSVPKASVPNTSVPKTSVPDPTPK